MKPDFENCWALTIGIGKYSDNNITNLLVGTEDIPQNDVDSFCNWLIKNKCPENNIKKIISEEATRKNIIDGLEWLQENLWNNNRTMPECAFVFYSGHGELEHNNFNFHNNLSKEKPKPEIPYLLPFDAIPEHFRATAINLDYFKELIINLRAKKVTCFIDSCFSGIKVRGKRNTNSTGKKLTDYKYEIPNTFTNRAIITSSFGHQPSYQGKKNGVFTIHLLEALNGCAESNDEGLVSAESVFDYIRQKFQTKKLVQSPSMEPMKCPHFIAINLDKWNKNIFANNFNILKDKDNEYYYNRGIKVLEHIDEHSNNNEKDKCIDCKTKDYIKELIIQIENDVIADSDNRILEYVRFIDSIDLDRLKVLETEPTIDINILIRISSVLKLDNNLRSEIDNEILSHIHNYFSNERIGVKPLIKSIKKIERRSIEELEPLIKAGEIPPLTLERIKKFKQTEAEPTNSKSEIDNEILKLFNTLLSGSIDKKQFLENAAKIATNNINHYFVSKTLDTEWNTPLIKAFNWNIFTFNEEAKSIVLHCWDFLLKDTRNPLDQIKGWMNQAIDNFNRKIRDFQKRLRRAVVLANENKLLLAKTLFKDLSEEGCPPCNKLFSQENYQLNCNNIYLKSILEVENPDDHFSNKIKCYRDAEEYIDEKLNETKIIFRKAIDHLNNHDYYSSKKFFQKLSDTNCPQKDELFDGIRELEITDDQTKEGVESFISSGNYIGIVEYLDSFVKLKLESMKQDCHKVFELVNKRDLGNASIKLDGLGKQEYPPLNEIFLKDPQPIFKNNAFNEKILPYLKEGHFSTASRKLNECAPIIQFAGSVQEIALDMYLLEKDFPLVSSDPYKELSKYNISFNTPIKEIRKKLVINEKKSWDSLRRVENRLLCDWMLYPVFRPENLNEAAKIAENELQIPDKEQIYEIIIDGEDKNILDIFLINFIARGRDTAIKSLENEILNSPNHGNRGDICHILAISYFAKAVSRSSVCNKDTQDDLRKGIAYFVINHLDDSFWRKIKEQRSKAYKYDISNANIKTVKSNLRNKISRWFTQKIDQCYRNKKDDEASIYEMLRLEYEAEFKGAELLKKVGGIKFDNNSDSFIGGNLAVKFFNLEDRFQGIVSREQKIVPNPNSKQIGLTNRELAQFPLLFTEFNSSIILLEENPEEALRQLGSLLKGPETAEYQTVMGMTLTARIQIGTRCIAKAIPEISDIDNAIKEWKTAYELSGKINKVSKIRSQIIKNIFNLSNQISERATKASNVGRHTDSFKLVTIGINLIERTINSIFCEIDDISVANNALRPLLADLYFDRGFELCYHFSKSQEAAKDMRKALQLNPGSRKLRLNFITVILGAGDALIIKGRNAESKIFYEEARNEIKIGQKNHPLEKKFEKYLKKAESGLHGASGILDYYLTSE